MSYIQNGGGGTAAGGGINASLLGNNTSGALALVSSGTLRLAGGNNITLSQNGQSVTISAANSNPGSLSVWEPWAIGNQPVLSATTFGQSSFRMWPLYVPADLSVSQMMHLYTLSIATTAGSSFAFVFSESAGIYTLTGSTLNLLTASSGATNYQFTVTGNSFTASHNNLRAYLVPMSFNASPGNYWIGILSITSSTQNNAVTVSHIAASVVNSTMAGTLGVASNATQQFVRGLGFYSAQTAALPASVNVYADLTGSSMAQLGMPYMQFQGT